MTTSVAAHTARERVVVVDNGTGFIKCGFAGDNFPRSVFANMVGRPIVRYEEMLHEQGLQDVMVGNACAAHRNSLQVSYPVSQGAVCDWDDMSLVWRHCFNNELRVDPRDCRILLTDPPFNATANRQRMLEIMFETFGFQAAYLQIQAVLTLYAQGLLTGLVVDSGDGVSHAVAVVQGHSSASFAKRLDVAGRHVTAHMIKLLQRRGYAFSRSCDFDTVRQIKERVCYIASDIAKERQVAAETTALTQTYTLPDGRTLRIGEERFMAPEVLFNPSLLDKESCGIAAMAFNTIQEVPIDCRAAMYNAVVLSGGSTMYPGMASRMTKELRQLYVSKVVNGDVDAAKKLRLRVEDPPQRKHMVFQGAAVLADVMKDYDDFWVTKAMFDEDPTRAVNHCLGALQLH